MWRVTVIGPGPQKVDCAGLNEVSGFFINGKRQRGAYVLGRLTDPVLAAGRRS